MKNWKTVKLMDICRPKQWPTISSDQLTETGYPVYGANGIIGSYSKYTHDKETVLITCRGATCGSIHICQPYVYVTGNAMALDELSKEVDRNFLAYYLKTRGLADVISGSAQPQITRQGLTKIKFPLPPLAEQIHIAQVLDQADRLRQQDRQLLAHYDQLVQAVFMDMFGDPVHNEKGWEMSKIKTIGKVITGNTPSRAVAEYYGSYREWIKSDNINTPSHFLTTSKEYLSEAGEKNGRTVPAQSILMTCIAGSLDCIGNVAIADRKVAFNQQINAVIPNTKVTIEFVYTQFLLSKKKVQESSTGGMKGMVSKGKLEEVFVVIPPLALQQEFSRHFALLLGQINASKIAADKSETLFNSLLQQAFRGELGLPKPAGKAAAGQLSLVL